MRISDERCAAFIVFCREQDGRELSLKEARETLQRLATLVDGFGKWSAKRKAQTVPNAAGAADEK